MKKGESFLWRDDEWIEANGGERLDFWKSISLKPIYSDCGTAKFTFRLEICVERRRDKNPTWLSCNSVGPYFLDALSVSPPSPEWLILLDLKIIIIMRNPVSNSSFNKFAVLCVFICVRHRELDLTIPTWTEEMAKCWLPCTSSNTHFTLYGTTIMARFLQR